jgi:hypothetical protein
MQRSNSCNSTRGEGAEERVVTPGVMAEGSTGGRACGVGASLTAVASGAAVTLACIELDTWA